MCDAAPVHTPLVFAVLGYRCHLTPALRSYLDRVASAARDLQPSLVITSGGPTNQRSCPALTEAALMRSYLIAEHRLQTPIELEPRARTTLENLRLINRMLEERGLSGCRLVLFCDRVRASKIQLAALRLLPRVHLQLHAHDFGRGAVETAIHGTVACLHEWFALRLPLIEKLGLALVELRMRLT